MFCSACGNVLEVLESGGCGGNGAIYGCSNPDCDRLFRQTTGGIIPTLGGESFELISGSAKLFRETGSAVPRPKVDLLMAMGKAAEEDEVRRVKYFIGEIKKGLDSISTFSNLIDFLENQPAKAKIARDSNLRDTHGHRF